jgi:dTDP-4-amino-4,6-dideoxygalactose transaminase/CBS domain-containing protein
MTAIEKLLITPAHLLRDALQRLDKTGEGVLLLVDDSGKLLRTVTDGDIRRLLLAGASMTDPLAVLPPLKSKVLQQGAADMEAMEIMNLHLIDQLPVVDNAGRPVAVTLRRDLDKKILLSTPHLGEYEMGFVEEAFRTNWIAPLGPNVDAFEREIADYVGIGYAAALASGTAAIHLALRVLGVGPGDTVFCSTFTFVASANPILYLGATPVFIDSAPESWNMSPNALARAFADAHTAGRLPKAVILVNLYGQSADIDPIAELCDRYGVPLVEDAAESLGATYKGRSSGTFGRVGIYSFNGNKIITTSGGGMLISDDRDLIERARALSTQAREPATWYEHVEVGYNYRMSNVLAGIGRGQLRVLEQRVEARRAIFDRYREGLASVRALRWMPEACYGRSTRWLSVCTIDASMSDITPGKLIEQLAGAGIEARHVWKPMHRQPLFHGCQYYPNDEKTSFSDRAFAAGVCLPSGSNLTTEQQARTIRMIEGFFQKGS